MRVSACLGLFLSLFVSSVARTEAPPDLAKQPTLYVVGYAHLDTQWRWEYPTTIAEYLPSTLHTNFALFEKYPHYVFNFSGSNRYRMIKEYYPADYERMRAYVRAGRWFPSGSSVEENDVNSPSAESVMRQILYGTHWFRRELGRTSAEFMLPDCFGFPASLPSLLAHMGIRGFSTQKLAWGSSAPVGGDDSLQKTPRGTPFNVGLWEGPDGRSVLVAFNPGDYSADITYDLTSSAKPEQVRRFVDWPARVKLNGETGGVFADYHYYGTGDIGGSPSESSVALVETLVTKETPLRIISATAEQMFLDITPELARRLPVYSGELELTEHSAGSLTSQAYQKRWNHRNELLADAAEKASVAAAWLGARSYPQQRLNDAWTLVMGGQFHDIQAGTSTPRAHAYSWNDEVLAMNQFASVLSSATEAVASSLDTRVDGTAVVVYNALPVAREDVVEAELPTSGAVRVFGPDGVETPSQISNGKVLFVARVSPAGYSVYDVRPAAAPASGALKVTTSSLENARYRITIDANGDPASIHDKRLNKELLSSPARLVIQEHRPKNWPAWNMDWEDQARAPRSFVSGHATAKVVEEGAARVAVEISRETEGSAFVQTIRLSAGDGGNRVELANTIDWRTPAAALKATFPLTASNPQATYNWEVGTIRRGNNDPKKYEVATHEWLDLSDASGSHGVTILTGGKVGSDKPSDDTVRLTLVYTPGLGEGNGRAYGDQISQDFGRHEILYGLASHEGEWGAGTTDWQALRLSQPLLAFIAPKHPGPLGRTFSLVRLNDPTVRVLALKKAEESDEIIVRLVEMAGKTTGDVRVMFPAVVKSAREVDGQERILGRARIENGTIATSFSPYQIRTFAVTLAPPASRVRLAASTPVELPFDTRIASSDGAKSEGGIDGAKRSLPAEMLPPTIDFEGIAFKLGSPSGPNALVPRGQSIALPPGARRVYVLAAADGDQKATFELGARRIETTVQNWTGFIGQWDDRTWREIDEVLPPRPDAPPTAPPRQVRSTVYGSIVPAFIKRAPVAWYASHHHDADGKNVPYAYSYLFAHELDVPPGTTTLRLPDNDRIRILALTTTDQAAGAKPAQPLYDTLQR
ncbi:MAG: glycoside hydrolase family 38 C-terminal domain-containing protein [Thermoanaerobaculia bacterium]